MNLAVSALVLFSSLLLMSALDSYGKSRRVTGPHGRVDSTVVRKQLISNSVDAYRIWKDAGYRGRTVLFVTDSWESFKPHLPESEPVSRPYPLSLFNLAQLNEQSYLDDRTFPYVASLNGILRSMVALRSAADYERLIDKAAKAKDYSMTGTSLYYPFEGLPRTFTVSVDNISTKEPLLMFVGASYFKEAEPDALYKGINSSGIQADSILLCKESGNEKVTDAELRKLDRFAVLIGMNPAKLN